MTLQRFSVVRSYFDLLISSFIICVLADAMVVTNHRAKAAASAKSLTFQTGVVESRGRAWILQNITGAIMSQDNVLVLLATHGCSFDTGNRGCQLWQGNGASIITASLQHRDSIIQTEGFLHESCNFALTCQSLAKWQYFPGTAYVLGRELQVDSHDLPLE